MVDVVSLGGIDMTKIPVMATAIAAYRFAFENYLRVIGLIWVCMFLVLGDMLWQFLPYFGLLQEAVASKNPQALLGVFGHLLIFEAIIFIVLIVQTVGITHLVFNKPVRWPFFYFALGSDFWRLLLGCFIVSLILFVAMILMAILSGVVLAIVSARWAGPNADPAQTQLAMARLSPVIAFCMYGVAFFFGIRLGYLLAPIAVNEKRIGIGRNWSLTRGNSWRLFGVLILSLLPLIALGLLQFGLLALFGGPSFNYFAAFGSPAASMAWTNRMMGLYTTYWYIYFAVWLLIAPIVYGPLLGGGAICYRALVPEEAEKATTE